MKRLSWENEPVERAPTHPYRDSAVFYVVLGAIIVGVALLTGGSLTRALIYAGVFFVLATSWSWWKWRQRLAAQAAEEERRREATERGVGS
jgi:membrane protein implicated in regulation of membrane protease activity